MTSTSIPAQMAVSAVQGRRESLDNFRSHLGKLIVKTVAIHGCYAATRSLLKRQLSPGAEFVFYPIHLSKPTVFAQKSHGARNVTCAAPVPIFVRVGRPSRGPHSPFLLPDGRFYAGGWGGVRYERGGED